MTDVRCNSRDRLHRPAGAWPFGRLSASLAKSGCKLTIAGSIAASLFVASMVPSFGQVCGTPPCGAGGSGKPVSISWVQDLEFGALAGDGTFAGTATINPISGAKTVTGGVNDFGGIHNPAAFTVKGDKNTTFTVTLPGSIVLSSGSSTMTLNNFTSNPSGFGVFGNNGQTTLTVGATLQVGAGQAAGIYTGVFTITVDYQ